MSPDSSSTGHSSTAGNTTMARSHRRLFLVVLAGLVLFGGVILSFLPPAAHRPGTASFRSAQSRLLTVQVSNSVRNYYTEYSAYPLTDDSANAETTPLRTDARITAVLMGTDAQLNPKKIKFLPEQNPFTEGRRGGLKPTKAGLALVDAWGEPLYVLLDADYSGEIDNLDPAADKKTLSEGVLVFSAGPDKDPTTWEDNVTSWAVRSHR